MDRKPGYISLVGRFSGQPEVAVTDTNGTIVTTVDMTALTTMTIAAQPDYPRTVSAFVTNAAGDVIVGTVTIVGQDQNGEAQTEVIAITAAGANNGVKVFSYITSATFAKISGTLTGSSDTIALGFGSKIGLPSAPGAKIRRIISAQFDDAPDAGTFSDTYGTYVPAGTMDGGKHLEVSYLFDVPVISY
jgi:hypothetical protein